MPLRGQFGRRIPLLGQRTLRRLTVRVDRLPLRLTKQTVPTYTSEDEQIPIAEKIPIMSVADRKLRSEECQYYNQ